MSEKVAISFKQVIQVVQELADYEMKRLLGAEPYVPAPASAPASASTEAEAVLQPEIEVA
jgi:hypothetical protein